MNFFIQVDARKTPYEVVVGLESNLAKVRNRMEQVNVLGLIGMGGIGKTTLAKAIFDEVSPTFKASCFIEDLKSRNSLEILCKILQNLGRDKESTWTLVDAQRLMRELLATKKILVILDDPKDAAQVREIIPEDVSCVNNGTKIIITTRAWALIENRVDMNGRIDVDKLDENAAKELFDA
jgi:ATPase subunit of ABC transporter with duplicated ATPase domains